MVMYTCRERSATLAATLASLGATDWKSDFSTVIDDDTKEAPSLRRQVRTFWRAAALASSCTADFVLLAEDDLRFNRYIQHNLEHANLEHLVDSRHVPRALSLYRASLSARVGTQAIIATPAAWLIVAQQLNAARSNWPRILTDLWLRERMAVNSLPEFMPSLVQHAAHRSTLAHPQHHSNDFDPSWRA